MKSSARAAAAFACALAVVACAGPPRGGVPESQLAAAVAAADINRVNALLASGADPNKTVDVDGRDQSPWFLALAALRPRQPGRVNIALALLKGGADPKSAWGTDRTGARETFWQKFSGPSRRGGAGEHRPLDVALGNRVPEVARALIGPGFDPRDGQSALAVAVETGDVDIVHALVEAGVDVNTTANYNTPLLAAITTRNVALMSYLEEHGAREKP